MTGIGTWTGSIKTMIYSGDVTFTIKNDHGEYGVEFKLPDGIDKIPEYTLSPIVEDGNTLSSQMEIAMLPGKKIDVSMTFEGDTMNGTVKIPFIGMVRLQNFKRIGNID